MGIFSSVSNLFKITPRKNIKEKYYNLLEKIVERASKGDNDYLIEARKYIENIIKETFKINSDEKIELNELIDLYINDIDLRERLHELRKRANVVAHEMNTKFDKSNLEKDYKTIDDLSDYCSFKNENINEFELFSVSKRIEEEPKIEDDIIFSSKKDTITFENFEDVFKENSSGSYEFYTSSYNAKVFAFGIEINRIYHRRDSVDCPSLLYVVHNILIRKDMVRKSAYLNKLKLTSAELDIVRIYEILLLHSFRYGFFNFDKKNIVSVSKDDVKYVKIAYENIMYYANILNHMQKNNDDLDYEVEFSVNSDGSFLMNGISFKYRYFKEITDEMKVSMWFNSKIDYEITSFNSKYYRMMLKDLFGFDDFRDGQLDVIKNILENNIDNIPLSVFPTGYGKSLIYQYCALLEPQKTIVIVPTEVLACDQIFNLNECGLNIGRIVSCYEKNLNDRNGNLIYYTIPDVFLNYELNEKLAEEDRKDNIYNIVLDECHNISLWGHQFDPTYFSLSKCILSSFKNCNVTMFTATASKLVINDIKNQFNEKKIVVYQPVGLKRGHINYQIKRVNSIDDIIKDISNIYKKNYGKDNNWDLNDLTNNTPNKTLIINNDPSILNKIYDDLQLNDYILPNIALYDDTVSIYKQFRTGRKKILVTNDDFVVGINIPELVNLICIGVPPSKEWLYQESGRVGRSFENSNVIIYLPNNPSELFNKIIDTQIDIKDLLANKKLQSQLNIDVSNINYFKSYFQDKEKQLSEFDKIEYDIDNNIYVSGKNEIGEINLNFDKVDKELYNYLFYMMVLTDYIKIWQTKSSDNPDKIRYRLLIRATIKLREMIDFLNDVITTSTNNIIIRGKYLRLNNKATSQRDLISNLLDWYYETIITIKREMLVNTYELLLKNKITSEKIEQNLAQYFDISSNMRELTKFDELIDLKNKVNEDIVLDDLEVDGVISTAELVNNIIEVGDSNDSIDNYEDQFFDEQEETDINEDIKDKTTIQVIELEPKEKVNYVEESEIDEESEIEEESEFEEEPEAEEEHHTSPSLTNKLINVLSEIYDDKNINFEFFDIYKQMDEGEKYNLQFILQREIESGYIYGYELMISIIELETKGSNLIRFNKFAKNTNMQLLELLINKDSDDIPHSNKKKAYKIIYTHYKPNSIFDKLKQWF